MHAPDVIQVGHNLTIGAGQALHNTVCILCSTEVGGHVAGNVCVFAGNVLVRGTVAGDVVVLGGNVSLAGTAAIHGHVLIVGGRLQQDAAATCGRSTVLPPIIFVPTILLICVVVGVLIRLTRRSIQGPVVFPPLPRL